MEEQYKTLSRACIRQERLKGRRKRGLEAMKYNIPRLFEYLEENNLDLQGLSVRQAQGYITWLGKQKDYQPATIRNIVNAALGFYRYLKSSGFVMSNPFLDIRRVREQKKLPDNILKQKQVDKLLEELTNFNQPAGFREKKKTYLVHVIAELMYATGMRIFEAGALRVADIDFERSLVQVRDGKGGRSRMCYLNEYALNVLKIYVNELRVLLFKASSKTTSLFGFRSTAGIRDMVNQVLKQKAKELEFGVFKSHGFRHALGFHLLRAGCDIRYIKEILGHRRLGTTEIYTKVEKGDLKRVLDKYHPRRWHSSA